MTDVPPERLRCRWCEVTFLKWRTKKDGTVASGWPRLREHMHDYHFQQYEQMQAGLGPDEEDDDV